MKARRVGRWLTAATTTTIAATHTHSQAQWAEMIANDADTLDQLLQLQLRVVDQKLARAKQARALQPMQAAHVQPVSEAHPHAAEPEMPWRQQMAAHQDRLDELARRNAALARECADAQARPPAEPPRSRPEAAGQQAEPSATESLLQESLKMQRDLMAHLTREAEASEARREEAADEDAQWAAELETMAALPAPPLFSHAPTGGAPPAGRESLQAQSPYKRSSKAEEVLRKEITAAMEGLSDEDSSADEASSRKGRGGRRVPLERNLGHATLQKSMMHLPVGLGGGRGRMSMAACGLALLFCYKLRTKYSPVTMGEDEVSVMLETLHEVASGWLRRPLRAVVQSVLRDVTLHMELSSVAGGRRLFGLLPATDGVPHDLQASKLKVRAKAIVDELAVLGGDAPPALLQSLHFLTSRRINWPSNALYASERAALHMAASGASSITATSPRVLTVGLLLTRTLLHRLLLQPREAMLAPKTTPRGMANLRMIAAMLYVLGCAVPLMPLRPEVRGAKLAAALKQDPEATAAFKGELERLEENGLPLLQEWVWEAAAVVYQWTQTVLRAARNAARDVAQDPLA